MTIKRKPADTREKELLLAIHRIEHGRAKTDEKKVTIAAVAREAGISAALIHNHYPNVAEAIREIQGRSSRAQRDVKHVSALESASFFPKISSSHLKSITSSLDFHYDHSRTC